jgi:hypothetical protein
MYADTVLASNPLQFYTLSGTDGGKNLSWPGYDITSGYTAGHRHPIVPGYAVGDISNANFPNPLGIFSDETSSRSWSLEVWARKKPSADPYAFGDGPFGDGPFGGGNASNFFISTSTDFFVFFFRQYVFAQRLDYVASAPYDEEIGPAHVVIINTMESLELIVNGRTTSIIDKDAGFSFGATPSLTVDSSTADLSGLAIYDRALSAREIAKHYRAGTDWKPRKNQTASFGADHRTVSREEFGEKQVISINAYEPETYSSRNLTLERGSLYLSAYPPAQIKNASSEPVTPTYSGGINLAAANHVVLPAQDLVGSSGGFIGVSAPIVASTATEIMTIFDADSGFSVRWSLSASSVLSARHRTYAFDGSQSSETVYTYSTNVPSTADRKIWFVFDSSGVYVSNWTLTGFNQVAGDDFIAVPMSLSQSAVAIFGGAEDLSGAGPAKLYDIYAGEAPVNWAGDFSGLESNDALSCRYTFDETMYPYAQGESVTKTLPAPDFAYRGSIILHDLEPDPYSYIQVSYNDGPWLSAVSGAPLPGVPASGNTNSFTAPLQIRAILYGLSSPEARPFTSSISVVLYPDEPLEPGGEGYQVDFTGSPAFRNETLGTLASRDSGHARFTAAGTLQFPALEVPYRGFELFFSVNGTISNGSVLAASRNSADSATNLITVSSTGTVAASGEWGTVYLNGRELSVAGPINFAATNHILVVNTAALTNPRPVFINAAINGSSSLSASATVTYSFVSLFTRSLTGATPTILNLVDSARGSAKRAATGASIDELEFGESPPRVSAAVWEKSLSV